MKARFLECITNYKFQRHQTVISKILLKGEKKHTMCGFKKTCIIFPSLNNYAQICVVLSEKKIPKSSMKFELFQRFKGYEYL